MSRASMALVLALFAALLVGGCTATVRPAVSASEYLSNQPKLNRPLVLYLTEELRNYESKHADPADLKEWHIVSGPAISDAFQFSTNARFTRVQVLSGQPKFPINADAATLVVVPHVENVEQTGPVVFKFEKYHVTLAMKTKVYNAAGQLLEEIPVTSKGSIAGAIGYESGGHAALPEACRVAIKEVVDETLQRIAARAGAAPMSMR